MTATHKLILIYGPGSGFGKSTTGQNLTLALETQGKLVEFLEEHDVRKIEAFQHYVSQVEAGEGDDIETLLACCQNFVSALLAGEPKITIIDSMLPCWDWLASAGCSQESINQFTLQLCEDLIPLDPLLVVLDGDLDKALNRAISDRGEEWALNLADARMGKRSIPALLEYFINLRAATENGLPFWQFKTIKVDTVDRKIADSIKTILDVL